MPFPHQVDHLLLADPAFDLGLAHANADLVPLVVVEGHELGGEVVGGIVEVDAGDAHHRAGPAAGHQADAVLADRKRGGCEEIDSLGPLRFQHHLVIVPGQLAGVGDAGHGVSHPQHDRAVLDAHLAVAAEHGHLPALERLPVEHALPGVGVFLFLGGLLGRFGGFRFLVFLGGGRFLRCFGTASRPPGHQRRDQKDDQGDSQGRGQPGARGGAAARGQI